MRNVLQLAAATLLLIATATSCAQIYTQPQSGPPTPPEPRSDSKSKHDKHAHTDVEWLWQYSPPPSDGRENALIQDPHFLPFLDDTLTAPQSFWGVQGTKYKPLADTAYDFLSVPGKVLADDNRYLSISGCVFHFCPDRGLLWVDLNAAKKSAGPEHLVVFAATDWIRESKVSTEPGAEYTLWVFANEAFGLTPDAPNRIPPALIHSIARWTQEPLAGSGIVENITHAIVVDPDGTPHQLPIAAFGVTPPKQSSETEKP